MFISEVSIRRPVLATMLISALVVFGIVSYGKINTDLFPDVDFPIVTVTAILEGADPETIETKVTDVIEEAINTISGIKTLRSESSDGVCQVFVEFELERNVDIAAQDVRDKVAAIRGELPEDMDPPIIEKFDLDAAPILAIAISGDASIREITDFADDVVKQRLERIEGVGAAKIVGGRDREIRIWLDLFKLKAYGLDAQDVITALQRENIEIPGGRVETGRKEFIVKTKGEMRSVGEFNDLIVAYRSSAPIKIKDVGYVEDGLEDARTFSRLNGKRAVSLLVRRQSGTNVVKVAKKVREELEAIKRSPLAARYDIVVAQDLSTFIEESIADVKLALILGGVFVVVIILLFLRNFRSTMISAVTVPSSIIATFSFVWAMGFTLNMMTMLALSISVGMLIDDAIVMLENIYRHREEGWDSFKAAFNGADEIAFAVVATSLAVIAVFVPVAFMSGMVGRFFYEFGMTVVFAVVVSTFMALTLTPMLCSQFLKLPEKQGRCLALSERAFQGVEAGYRRMLQFALRHRGIVLTMGIVTFILSLGLTKFLGKEFVPAEDESAFNIQVEAPTGSSLEETSGILGEIEELVRNMPGVTDVFMTIGGGAQERVNLGAVLVKMVGRSERSFSQRDLMQATRRKLSYLTKSGGDLQAEADSHGQERHRPRRREHLRISVEDIPRVSGGGFRAALIQFNIRGPSLEKLEDFANRIMDEMSKIDGIVDINSSYETGKPEVNIYVNRSNAADLGVSVQAIAATIRALIGGQDVTQYRELGDRYDVRVRLIEEYRDRPADIKNLAVKSKSGELIDFENLVDVVESTGPLQIDRQSRQRQITILANLTKEKPLSSAVEDINRIAGEMEMPSEYETSFTGFADLMRESFESITFSLALAIVMIYMILAGQFDSFIHPLTIMFSVPLSIVGALGLLLITGHTLNIFSMIGMIMLMGMVTKNAILLVDYTNTLRKRGATRDEALLAAGPIRLRPILMTTVSTIFGMMPIALGWGAGSETRAPMAVCVIGGMSTSTLLTLVIVPVVYSLFDDLAKILLPRERETSQIVARTEQTKADTDGQ